MGLAEWGTLIGIALGIFGFLWKLSSDFRDVKVKTEERLRIYEESIRNDLKKMDTEHDAKRSRIYERLDEHKKDVETKFVQREICHVMHKAIVDTVANIQTQMASGFESLGNKIDNIIKGS